MDENFDAPPILTALEYFKKPVQVFEALRVSGGDRVVACLTDMYGEYQLFLEAEKEDNKKDDDKDGIADVDQLVGGGC